MNEIEHDELRNALGAFVLDAAPEPEMRRIERHVSGCDSCAHEVFLLRETVAELAWLAPPEDASGLVERITSSLPWRRRRIVNRIAVGVAAASVVVAGVLGTALVREHGHNDQLVRIVASADRRVTLHAEPGFAGRGGVYVSGNRVAFLFDHMPAAGRARTYQLWAIAGHKPRSLGVVTGRGHIERTLSYAGRADVFAVTIEPVGGSPVPTSNPVLAGG